MPNTAKHGYRLSALTRMAAAAALLILAAASSMALAQERWPARAITLVIPFPPGGGTDIIARTVAVRLQEKLGRPVVIDNRPGAGGLIGTQQVAKAAPDGYTYVIGITNTFAINPAFYKSLPYDPVRDFQPVSMLAIGPHVLVIHPDTPARTIREYIEYGKAQKGKLSYASYGNGSTAHLITEMLKEQNGLDFVHVPYKGIPPALADLMAGRVTLLVSSTAPAVPLIQAGRLRALAIYGDKRLESLPDVPTMAELGFKDTNLQIWYGLFAPAGTPPPVVERMNSELRAILGSREVQDIFVKAGIFAAPTTVDDYTAFVRAETERWGRLVRISGAQAE